MTIITVASGKGGVGKTTLVANIGIALAEKGHRVVLFDADLGLANLDVILGVKSEVNVRHAIEGFSSLREVMVEGPAGVRIVTGSSGIGTMLRLSRKRLGLFLTQISEIEKETDFLIFDASSGADARVMTFLRAADQALLVTTPDPASIVDVYATAKILFRSKPDAFVRIVVNMVEDEEQAHRVFAVVQSAADKFIGRKLYYGGHVRLDPHAAEWTRLRTPFVLAKPKLPASRDVKALSAGLDVHLEHRTGDQHKAA